ncbi:hypothetical protein HYT23_03540 [Candidatus Pacearchaeota archaeon]|nr:hypothetical protein [Candidatus Pacearchaeota archaeon]
MSELMECRGLIKMRKNQEEKGDHSYIPSQISHILEHLGFEYSPLDIQFYANREGWFRFPKSRVGFKIDSTHAYVLRGLKPRVFTNSLNKLFEAMNLPITIDDFNLSAKYLGYEI